jgi:hypothetical protein
MILSLGGLHLSNMPVLETLHVYKMWNPPYVERDEEYEETLADSVKAWSRFCAPLREVQFDRDQMWRREDVGDQWIKRRFEWTESGRVILG